MKLITISTLIIILLAGCTSSEVVPHDYECDTYIGTIKFTAPVPEDASPALIEKYEETVCDSVAFSSDIMESELTEGTAVCDTDSNCDLWELGHEYGVKGVYAVPINPDNDEYDYNAVLVTCEEAPSVKLMVTDYIEKDFYTICQKDITEYLGRNPDFPDYLYITLNHNQLVKTIEYSKTDINLPIGGNGTGPTLKDVIKLTEEHPEVLVRGMYRSSEMLTELIKEMCENNKDCIISNTGLFIDEIIKPNDKQENWFQNFCYDADENNNFRCWWD